MIGSVTLLSRSQTGSHHIGGILRRAKHTEVFNHDPLGIGLSMTVDWILHSHDDSNGWASKFDHVFDGSLGNMHVYHADLERASGMIRIPF